MSSMCASAQLSPAAGARRSVSLRAAQRSAFAPAPARCLRAATAPAGRSRGASLVVRAEEAATQGSDPKTLTTSLPSVLDINEIMNRLPHRFPFLLVRAWRPGAFLRSRPVSVSVLTRAAAVPRVRAGRWTASSSTCPASTRSASRT